MNLDLKQKECEKCTNEAYIGCGYTEREIKWSAKLCPYERP